jgi:hypothetical protein
VGGGYSTDFTIVNSGITSSQGRLEITDQSGNPLMVNLVDKSAQEVSDQGEHRAERQTASYPLSMAPGAVLFLTARSLDPTDPVQSGWARVEYDGGYLGGVGTFQLMQGNSLVSLVGVLASGQVAAATIPFDNDGSANRYTGFAVANPNDEEIRIRLVVLDESGTVIWSTEPAELNPLGPRQQVARFLHEYLPSTLSMRGSMVLSPQTDQQFAVTALVQNQGLLTAVPVIPGKAPVVQE